MNILPVVAPVFLLILIGHIVAISNLISQEHWRGVESVVYKLLIPSLIVSAIYKSELAIGSNGQFIFAIVVVTLLMVSTLLAILFWGSSEGASNASNSSVFQSVTRWSTLVPIPVAAAAFGEEGIGLVAVAIAVLVPLINVVNIVVVSALCGAGMRLIEIARRTVSNPLIIGSFIGIGLSQSGLQLGSALEQTIQLLGTSAMPIGLICIGAGFRTNSLAHPSRRVIGAVVLKNVIAPALLLLIAPFFELSAVETVCGMLIVSTPAAANGYVVARALGGDAELYAVIMSWQFVASIVSIPIILNLTSVF